MIFFSLPFIKIFLPHQIIAKIECKVLPFTARKHQKCTVPNYPQNFVVPGKIQNGYFSVKRIDQFIMMHKT
jgi:hypothetical protein